MGEAVENPGNASSNQRLADKRRSLADEAVQQSSEPVRQEVPSHDDERTVKANGGDRKNQISTALTTHNCKQTGNLEECTPQQ